MLNVDSNDNGEKKSTLTSKKNIFARAAHFFCTFLCHCCGNVKLPSWRKCRMCSQKILCLCSSLFFFSLPLILSPCWLLTFSFSHGRHKIFMLFFQCNSSPLFFLSCCSSLLLFFSMSFTISPVTRQKSPLSDLIWYGTKVNLL